MKGFRANAFVLVAGLVLGGVSLQYADAQNFEQHGPEEMQAADQASASTGVGEVLHDLAARAGVVFVGRVESIEIKGGVTEVAFSVQKPVIGEVGTTYTVREWGGRWAGGQEHYRIGQRALIFLYAPNEAGLSSPVDGMAGVVPVIPMGADADPMIDVRWLETRVERPVGKPIADADFGAVALSEALAVVRGDLQQKPKEPVRRPLPVGLRWHPVKSVAVEEAAAGLVNGLQTQGGADVEH